MSPRQSETRRPATGQDFLREYADRSDVSVEWLSQHRTVRPCDCAEDGCEGWQMVAFARAADIDDQTKPWAR